MAERALWAIVAGLAVGAAVWRGYNLLFRDRDGLPGRFGHVFRDEPRLGRRVSND